MKKRLFAIFLVLAMVFGLLPMGAAAEPVTGELDYSGADAIFDALDKLEQTHATRSTTQSQLTDAAQELVEDSEDFVPGSLKRNGDAFSWMTVQGIRCAYSPRLRRISEGLSATGEDVTVNEPKATRGGWPSGKEVYLIGPYYGYDSDFTDQYKNEAKRVATAMGDTDGYTLYSGKNATVDKVAEAVSKGAVVFFDSHGTTDYENGYDYVTGATSSYLCLTSTTGLTSEDYADGAMYYDDGICINGATIANHMTSNSPAGILWMAICLGMATDTMCEPLRAKGVEVVCGYSQSVTFAGDYLFEDTFWDNMCAGKTVAQANAAMKDSWGQWDWSTKIASYYGYRDGYSTISAARADYAAFPVVVSDEDAHPGQRSGTRFYGADSLQTVNSTYTLFSQYAVSASSSNSAQGTVSVSGNVITAHPATGYFASGYTLTAGTATVTQNGNQFLIQAESDCTIVIHFAPKTLVTVNFSGAQVPAQNAYQGDPMNLPVATAPEGYSFVGWTTAPLAEDMTALPVYYDTTYTATGDTTLYALYSYVDESSSTGTGDYVKVTTSQANWEGQYLIVFEGAGWVMDSALTSYDKVSNYRVVTFRNDTIPGAEGDAYCFTVAKEGSGYSIRGVSGKYIGNSSNSNALTTSADPQVNRISMGADGSANIIGSGGAYLRFNNNSGQYRFRYYKSSSYANQEPIALYRKDGAAGVTYYTSLSSVAPCTHTQVVNGVCEACGETFAAKAGGSYYATVQAAVNAGHTQVQLLRDSAETVTGDTLWLDLNGHTLEAVRVYGILYGYDSSATAQTEGSGFIHGITGVVAPECLVNGVRYVTLEDHSYSFHVLELSLQTVSLRSRQAGLYYRATLTCDSALRGQITGYGIALSTADMPGVDYYEAHNRYTYAVGAPRESFASAVVTGIFESGARDNDERGRTPIYANAYFHLADGRTILADPTNYDTVTSPGFEGAALSMYDVLQLVGQNYPGYTTAQQTTLKEFYATWQDPLATWQLPFGK